MKTATRYLLREVLINAGLGLLLFTFVLLMSYVGRLMEVMVRSNSASVLLAFVYVLPAALIFTIPMSVLVGVLLGLGRLSADNELIALRASGFSRNQLLRPLLLFLGGALAVSLLTTGWIAPLSAQKLLHMETSLRTEAAFEIPPRVFLENIPHLVVYVGDTLGRGDAWRQVFVADMHQPLSPRITMAAAGELIDRGNNTVQLHLANGTSYESDLQHPDHSNISAFASADVPLELPAVKASAPPLPALSSGSLWRRARYGADWRVARIELYRRFALAFACLSLSMLGIALGLSTGRSGKAGGFVLTLILVFAYYILFYVGIALARQGKISPFWGVWAANFIFLGYGLWRMRSVDRVPRGMAAGTDPVARARAVLTAAFEWLRGKETGTVRARTWIPSLIDAYVVREFLGYLGLMLASFLVLVLIFTFFDLVGDILRTHTSMIVVLQYLLYLSPQMLYLMIPVAILVAVLVTFGLMSKANEVTALKACGVSIYRLMIPVLLVSFLLCGVQFGLDATWLPGANRKQDALRNQIKGHPAQTFQLPERKWMFGKGNDIYYFQFFDPGRNEFANISVYRFDPQQFQLTQTIFARSAHWDEHIQGWVFDDGWVRDMKGSDVTRYQPFLVAGFKELHETPSYFKTESLQGTQMSYPELSRYIQDLQRSGYDVARLSVQLQKKIAYPLITIVMALLAFPFSLSVGRRGTVTGMALAISVAIVYWVSAGLLEAMGNLGQLPPMLAAWAPDILFALAGGWLLLRVAT